MNLKWIGVLALVCFAMLVVDAGKVSFKMGDGTKRTIYAGANLWGGQTVMVTRSTKVDGHVTFTRFFYNVHTSPILRAAVRKVTGSFDLGDKTVSNVDATAVTHVLWLPRMVLYHESNNIPGMQLNDTISQGNVFNLAPVLSGGSFTWSTDISNYATTDGVTVYVISACGSSTATGGSACFYFHTGNGTYTRGGVTVYPGEFKIDKVWTLGTAIKTKISTANAASAPLRMALVGYVVSSTDTIDNGTFTKQDSNGAVTSGSNSVEIDADYTIQFTSGDTGYVNVNKTCIFVHTGAANETVDILMREIDLTTSVSGSASTSITINGNQFGTYAGSGSFSSVRTRKVFVWSFMSDLTDDLSQIVWDPTIGTSDQNENSASFASASLLLVSFLAILGVLMGKLY